MRTGGGIIISGENGKKLTKEESLFLHLVDYNYNIEDYVVSEMVTARGIQRVLKCDIGYISRILNKNRKSRYIRCEKIRVENKLRIQNGFFLTQSGKKKAQKINEFVNGNK